VITQRAWVDGEFAHAALDVSPPKGRRAGPLRGERCVLEGASILAAKVFVTAAGTVLLEEMDPALKPFALEIACSVRPDRVLLRAGGAAWQETEFLWGEQTIEYRMVFDRLPRALTVSARLGEMAECLPASAWQRSRKNEPTVRRAWRRACIDDCPRIECPDPRLQDLLQLCVYVNRSNVLQPGGMLPYPFGAPSKFRYSMWWMWDSAFQAMTCAWFRDPGLAFGNLLSHSMMQSRSGCIMDAGGPLYGDTADGRWISPEWYDEAHSPSTGPCVTGIAVWDVYLKTGSMSFLRRMVPHMVAYERWIAGAKTSGIDADLIAYHSWYDVGWDDSKRWGRSGMGDPSAAGLWWDLPVVPVDANVFFLLLRECMAAICEVLGDACRAREYEEKARATRKAIDRHLWNEKLGFYFDILPNGRMLDLWTPAGFLPLLAGIPSEERYRRMRSHLVDPGLFWPRYPLPTVAMNDDSFLLEDRLWRGGTWVNVNWQVGEGLFHYDREIALQLLWKTVDLLTRDGHPVCAEYFDPRDGRPKGAPDYGWTTLIMDSLLRRVFGIRPMGDHLELDPQLPAGWPQARVRNVFSLGTTLDITYERSAGAVAATVRNRGPRSVVIAREKSSVPVGPGRTLRL
jgi:glycogen debranching enzyme